MKAISALTLAALSLAFASEAFAAPGRITRCPTTITQPGVYEVQDNLDATGYCIIVQADFVTIDLGGFRIRGNGRGAGVSAIGGVVRDTTVRNGTVMQFENGIELSTGLVENVKSLDNANVGILVSTGTVRNSEARGNLNNHGIAVGGRSIVSGNISVGNRNGISATHASMVHGNLVADSVTYGIITDGTGLSILNNSVFNNPSIGIYANCPAIVMGNIVGFSGTHMQLNGSGCTVANNNP